MKPIILLDMDEVLVDFQAGACKVFGTTREELENHRENNEWEILNALSKITGQTITPEIFWERIHAYDYNFWVDLKPLPWIYNVLALIQIRTTEWYIVSAPSRNHSSHLGKIVWLKKFFGEDFNRFILTPHKHLFAKRKTLLIDDRESNIRKFSQAGGDAILFPSTGNCLAKHAANPVEYLADSLQTYFGE